MGPWSLLVPSWGGAKPRASFEFKAAHLGSPLPTYSLPCSRAAPRMSSASGRGVTAVPVTTLLSRETAELQFCGHCELATEGGLGGSVSLLPCPCPVLSRAGGPLAVQARALSQGPAGRWSAWAAGHCAAVRRGRDPTECPPQPPQSPFAASISPLPLCAMCFEQKALKTMINPVHTD